jgi:uncharacterized protein YkwD
MIRVLPAGTRAALAVAASAVLALVIVMVPATPSAGADNKRLNDGIVANVYTIQHQAGCTNDIRIDLQLQAAAQRHTLDVLNNPNLAGDTGSDGSTPQDRANAAGFHGNVAETVAMNPSMAISGMELLNQWYHNPADLAIMQNCTYTAMGVWSESHPDRTVVVALYGQSPTASRPAATASPTDRPGGLTPTTGFDPSPDYDASDEVEYGVDWWAWILRGAYPPPAYPPS